MVDLPGLDLLFREIAKKIKGAVLQSCPVLCAVQFFLDSGKQYNDIRDFKAKKRRGGTDWSRENDLCPDPLGSGRTGLA